jgi:hypothetical protein
MCLPTQEKVSDPGRRIKRSKYGPVSVSERPGDFYASFEEKDEFARLGKLVRNHLALAKGFEPGRKDNLVFALGGQGGEKACLLKPEVELG